MTRRWLRRVAALGLVTLTACAGDDAGPGPTTPPVESDGMVVRDVWVRPTPAVATEASFYLSVENTGTEADALLGGRSNRCLTVAVHKTTIDDAGVAVMEELDEGELTIAPGETVVFEPIGKHLMCVGLDGAITSGDAVSLDLVFEHHPTVTVAVLVSGRE